MAWIIFWDKFVRNLDLYIFTPIFFKDEMEFPHVKDDEFPHVQEACFTPQLFPGHGPVISPLLIKALFQI